MNPFPAFLSGAALSAWVSIWVPYIGGGIWAQFIFAYILVFVALAIVVKDRGVK
jgi:hypothetical protein